MRDGKTFQGKIGLFATAAILLLASNPLRAQVPKYEVDPTWPKPLPGLMVTGRAGSAIAAEIGIMRTSEQIDALELMGLNPLRYVVVPNVLASVLALPVLTVVFDVIGIFGGYLVGVRLLGLNGGTYFGEMGNYVEMKDILGGIYKALTFGLLIGWVCCYKGYHSRFGAEGVSAATTQAVVSASVLILVSDYFVTSVVF